jgi:hypothetical protein
MYTEAEWTELAAEGRRILQGVARKEGMIDYGDFNRELAEATGLPAMNLGTEAGRADISRLLVVIAELDWEDGSEYMLTSLVKLSGENYPGKGFFTLAQQEGLYNPEMPELEFWSKQVSLAHQAHQRVRPARG